MFTSDKRFAILASAVPTSTPATAPGSLNCLQSLDDVTFHTLDLFTGKISDKWTFKSDFIYLSHQAGVHLYEDLLAVVSVQNQTIHVLRIDVSCHIWHFAHTS